MLDKLRYIFNHKEKVHIAFLLFVIVLGAFLELMGVAAFMPFIYYIMNPTETIRRYPFLQDFFNVLGMTTYKRSIAALAITICIIYILKNIYLIWEQNSILKFSYHTRMNLATKLLTTYMHEPYTFHLKRNIAESQRSLITDTQQFMLLLSNALQVIAEGMVVMVLGIFLFATSHSMTLAVMGMLVLVVGGFTYISKNVSSKLGKQNEYYMAKMNQWINQALGGIKEVKVLKREQFFIDSYRDNYEKEIKGAKTNELLAAAPKYVLETACIVGMLAAVVLKLFLGRQDVDMGTFVSQMSAFAVASFRLLPSAGKINAYVASINYCKPSLDNVYDDLKSIEGAIEGDFDKPDAKENASFEENLHVEDVVYHYPESDRRVIDHVTFSIPKGSTVALVGESGAGKTTLADIILGLLEPVSGGVYVDDWKTSENPAAWHRLLGYIPQTIYLTDDTIRNNIAFGIKPEDIDEEAVKRAISQVQLDDFVNDLPEGLDSMVGDRGVRISGGQRQRIGIARALYKNPDILVLDEATSALDNETEAAVMEAIDALQGQKTMIIIAHRLTTIRNADVIYEVTGGKIKEKSKKELGL